MIVNTHYNFIFVHIPKTAGTSIRRQLELIDGLAKHLVPNTKHEILSDFFTNSPGRLSENDRINGIKLDEFFTIAFVRNPWDRMASVYHYLRGNNRRPQVHELSSLNEFILLASNNEGWIMNMHSMRQQVEFFELSGRLQIGFLGHFEYLNEDVAVLADQIGIDLRIGHHNESGNARRDYREQYSNESVEIIADLFADDIRHFGYRFEDPLPGCRVSGALDRPIQ